jgi:hypothetical protein
MQGTRQPPSQLVFFSPRNGVMPASGQVLYVRPVVGGVEDDGVVGDAELVEQVEELADVHVVLDHAVGVLVLAGDAAALRLHVGAEVHARCRVEPDEPGLAGLGCSSMKRWCRVEVSSSMSPCASWSAGRCPRSSACRRGMAPRSGSRRAGRLLARSCRLASTGRWGSRGSPAPPRRSGGRGCRRTRRSRGWSAGTRRGRRGGSCRTGRWRSPAPSAAGDGRVLGRRPSRRPGEPTLDSRCGTRSGR